MQSKARNVATYVTEVPADRRAAIKKLRQLCLQNLVGYEECMDYGMPCYKHEGVVKVSFASQKQYIALYGVKQRVVDEFRSSRSAASFGKGCIRFTKPEKIDFDVIQKLLRKTAEANSASG